MRLYHITDRASAEEIIGDGFKDAEVIHDDRELLIGVWLADRCLSGEDDVGPRLGPLPDVSLVIELPAEAVEAHERKVPQSPTPSSAFLRRSSIKHKVADVQDLEEVDVAERRRQDRALETP